MRSFRSIYDKKLKKKNKNPVAVSSWCVETPWLGGWIIFDSKKNNSSPKNDDVWRCGKNQPRYTYSIDIITEADMSHISYIPFGHYIRGMMTCRMNWMISWLYFPSSESVISAVVKQRKVRLCSPYHVSESVCPSYMFIIIMVSLQYHVLNYIDRILDDTHGESVSPLIVIRRNVRGVHAGDHSEHSQYWWDVHERDLRDKYMSSLCCGYEWESWGRKWYGRRVVETGEAAWTEAYKAHTDEK